MAALPARSGGRLAVEPRHVGGIDRNR